MSCGRKWSTSDSVRSPCATVVPYGLSSAARSVSTWIHWWSRETSANLSMSSWVISSHSVGPSSRPISSRSCSIPSTSTGSIAAELMDRLSPAPSRRDVQESRLHLAQPIQIAARAERRVVEQERLRQPHDRVPQHGRLDRWVVPAGAGLLVDQLRDHRDHLRLHDPVAGGDDSKRRLALRLDELAEGRSVGELAVEAIECLEESRAALAAGLGARRFQDGRGGENNHLTDQGFTGSEPAVDRRAAEPELAGDGPDVDAPPAEVAVQRRVEDLLPGGRRRTARPPGRRCRIRGHGPDVNAPRSGRLRSASRSLFTPGN